MPGRVGKGAAQTVARRANGVLVSADFAPAWWLPSPHLQTLWPTLLRHTPLVALRRERVELADGDFVDLDWCGPRGGPLVLVLHGLEGSARSHYVRGLLAALTRRGWRGAVLHFRGCSGEPNRLDRSYHSGDTGDIEQVVGLLRSREPDTPLAAVGYSLGGNALLKWLGERPASPPLRAAVAVSVPFVLAEAAARLERGASRIYQWHLLRLLRHKLHRKYRDRRAPFDLGQLARWRSFREFDHRVTAPLHGFEGVDDYYNRASSRQYLGRIRVPTLLVQARDDPFFTEPALPSAEELSAHVRLEVSARGGHVGFVAGRMPLRPRYWLDERVPAFLAAYLGGC